MTAWKLHFLGNKIAFQAAGADFKGHRGSPDFSLYLYKIGFPGTANTIFGMTYRIAGNCMFSADVAGP
jgi:hypothetical protein